MRYMYGLITAAFIFFSGCSVPQAAPEPLSHSVECNGSVYALNSAQCLEDDLFIERIEPYSVIFMGDHHLSKNQHMFVADTIRALGAKGYRIHLANEWFSPEDNALLAEYSLKKMDDGNFTQKSAWEKRVSFAFDTFSPIYHAVRDNGGVLYGVNLSKSERKRISDVNVTGMSSDEKVFFESLDLNVSAHRQLLAPYFSRCHRPKEGETDEECLTRMYRVQVAWDAKMGRESAKLAKEVLKTPKDKLIVFVGAMHMSNGLGVNLRFARESNLPFVTVVPQSWDHTRVLHGEADFVYLYEQEKAAIEAEEALIAKLKEKNKN